MKKLFLLLSFITLICLQNSFSQTSDSISVKYLYCELVGTRRFLSYKVTMEIDYGQERKFFQQKEKINDANGKVKTFNSMVDALNYMAEHGWEFVQAYVVSNNNQNVYRWLLKKKKTLFLNP